MPVKSENKEQETTPKPWITCKDDTGTCIYQLVGGSERIAYVSNEANAKLIVHCVNTHDYLVEALNKIKNELRGYSDNTFGKNAYKIAEKALSKAGEL